MSKPKLSPVQHASLNDHHRVPVVSLFGKYEVYVGDNFIRLYSEDDLPDIIKSRIAMVKAATVKIPDSYLTSENIGQIYTGDPMSPMYEIGWQVSKELFVVVIPSKDLTYLRGEANNMSMQFVGARQTVVHFRKNLVNAVYGKEPSTATVMNDRPTFRDLDEVLSHVYWRMVDDARREGES
jgi:hypothetical protein